MPCHYAIIDSAVVGETFGLIFPHTFWFHSMFHIILISVHSWVPVAREPAGISLVAKCARHSSYPIPIDNTSELALFRYYEVLDVKVWMCKNEGIHSTGLRDPADQLAQEHRETLRNWVLFGVYVEHKGVVCFSVAGCRTLDIYGVIVWIFMNKPSVKHSLVINSSHRLDIRWVAIASKDKTAAGSK